jgi:hypothetical protein
MKKKDGWNEILNAYIDIYIGVGGRSGRLIYSAMSITFYSAKKSAVLFTRNAYATFTREY